MQDTGVQVQLGSDVERAKQLGDRFKAAERSGESGAAVMLIRTAPAWTGPKVDGACRHGARQLIYDRDENVAQRRGMEGGHQVRRNLFDVKRNRAIFGQVRRQAGDARKDFSQLGDGAGIGVRQRFQFAHQLLMPAPCAGGWARRLQGRRQGIPGACLLFPERQAERMDSFGIAAAQVAGGDGELLGGRLL